MHYRSTYEGLPFFLPNRLIEFEYLKSDNQSTDEEYNKLAKPFSKEIDFAFFVANFGYTKADYNALTEREKMFIMKAWEEKQVLQTALINKAVSNAVCNALRKKNSRAMPLWKKKPKKANKEQSKALISDIEKIEKTQGKFWVDKIYKANGIKREVKANG